MEAAALLRDLPAQDAANQAAGMTMAEAVEDTGGELYIGVNLYIACYIAYSIISMIYDIYTIEHNIYSTC